GIEKEISIPVEEQCRACDGSGNINHKTCLFCHGKGIINQSRSLDVKIPAGVHDGSRLSIKGEGYGAGVLKGDLYLNIHLEKHDLFEIEENNIICEIPVTVTEAILGTDIEVPTLKNHVKMRIPAGTQPGMTFRLKGKGIYNKKDDLHGDQLVKIRVVIPKNITDKEKKLYTELSLIERIAPRENIYK
ncbi:MAG: hypothetical protein H7263_11525, partial [Candidatus Sericytochromatia bacterium]|nr:hypothetical protein [Candidatus Sericytochromatia bacterium]